MMDNVREYSNGESAFHYFAEKIGENALFLLDEPENSLSPERQQELVRFLEDSARFFGCQFVISRIRRLCFPYEMQKSMIWMLTLWTSNAGPSWKMYADITIFLKRMSVNLTMNKK